MNFEQNFDQPLDPSSPEYQSLNQFDAVSQENPKGPVPIKTKKIPGTSIPVPGEFIGLDIKKETRPFALLEGSIRATRQAGDEYKDYSLRTESQSGKLGVYGDLIAPGETSPKDAYTQLSKENKELLLKYSNDINKPIDSLLSSGKWKDFFTKDGVLDESKAKPYFEKISTDNGGGTYLRDTLKSKFEEAGKKKLDLEQVQGIFKEEAKKANLPIKDDGSIDLKAAGIDLTKYGAKALKDIAPDKFNKLELIKSDADSVILSKLNELKSIAATVQNGVGLIQQDLVNKIKNGLITQEDAQLELDKANSEYTSTITELDTDFKKFVRDTNLSSTKKYSRIQKELDSISGTMTIDDVLKTIPASERNKIKSQIDEVKGRVSSVYEKSYNKLYESRELVKKASETAGGLGFLASKALASGWNQGLAALGGYMNMHGVENSFADWLTGAKTTAEELAPAKYKWNGEEWIQRGVSSSMASTGASLPITIASVGVSAAGSAVGVPAVGIGLVTGIIGYLGERAQNTDEVYRKELAKSGNAAQAYDKARVFENESKNELPFHILGGLLEAKLFQLGANSVKSSSKSLVKSIAEGSKNYAGQVLLEEYPTEVIQGFNQAKADGYKNSIIDYASENPEIFLDTIVSTVGQSSVFYGAGKVFGAFTKSVPESGVQFYANLIQKKGAPYARLVAEKYYQAGILDQSTAVRVLDEVNKITDINNNLKESGLDDNAIKLYMSLTEQSNNLKKVLTEDENEMTPFYQQKLKDVNSQLSNLAKNELPYIVLGLPGGNDSRVISVSTFQSLPLEKQVEVIKASNTIDVVNDNKLNESIKIKKQQLGNTQGAPSGMFNNNINIQQNATQESGRTQQEITQQGGIGQYQGTEGQQAQATDETDISNRPINGTQEVINFSIPEAVSNVQSSLESTGVKVEVIEDEQEFDRLVKEMSGQQMAGADGLFNPNTGTILLNPTRLKQSGEAGRIIWHEGAHPVMNIIRNTNKPVYDAVISGLKKAAESNPELAQSLAWAREGYTGDARQMDEAIVETIGKLNDGTLDINTIPTGLKQSIIDVINLIAKTLGLGQILDITDIAQFKKVASEVANALKTGTDVTSIVGKENVQQFQDNIEDAANSMESSIGIDVEFNVDNLTNRSPQLRVQTWLKKEFIVNVAKDLVGKKVSRVVFYDNTRVGRFTVKNLKNGYSPDFSGMGGFGYSFIDGMRNNKMILAFTSVNQAIQTLKRQMKYPDSIIAVAMQKQMTAHLGNIDTYNVLFDKDKGIFQNAVKNKTEEKEILGVIIKEIKELSSKNSKESKDIAKLIDGINLDEIQTITEFAEKVLRGGNDSFQNRGTILKYLLQDKQTKITKSTREAHQVLHYKYGIPTLQDIALGMNEEHFSNAELGDVVKYVRPDVKNLVIYTTDNNLFDELSKKPTKEMVKNNIKIELLPSELGHISYPFVIKGENLGIGDNYLNAVDMYNEQKKAGLKKSQSFFTLGRQKADASTGVIPESPESQGTPINLPESSTNKIQARISVFHGSPHAFDKFSTKKIGSGEGAQAFGWGLYFTELKDIAQSYANKLSDYFPDNSIADNPLANKFIGEDGQWKEYQEMGYTLIDAAKELNKIYQDSIKDSKNGIKNIDIGIENAKYAFQEQQASKKKKLDYIIEKENLDPNDQYQKQKIEEYKDALNYYDNEPNWEGMKQERLAYYEKEIKRDTADADATKFVIDNIDKYKKRRTLYEVILHEGKTPEQYQYMRWDEVVPGSIIKKLQSQSEKEGRDWSMYNHEEIKVIEAPEWTNKKGYVVSNGSDGFIGNVYETKDEANKYRDGIINNYKINGNELYRNLISEIGSPEKASKFLLDAGIDGIKYPAESAGRNNENVRGFNYVVFDDSEISVGNKVQYRKSSIKWEKSKEGKGDPSISSRNAVVMQAANDLKNGKISNEEYRAVVSENSPIRPITRFFEPANENDIFNALSVDKRAQINQPIDNGQIVGLRLDIPAYKNNNTWVVSVHDGNTNAGKVLSYDNAARITNVTFGVEPKGALAIATGKPKATIGRMFGEWQNIEGATLEEKGEAAKKIVEDIANSEEWVQVGMNPFRHSYFYDRSSDLGRPINSAEEVVQVGGLVYAKNPEYGNWTDEAYRVKGLFDKNKAPVQFRRGIVPTGGVPSVPGETGIEKTGETGLPQKKVYSWEKGEEGKPQPGETMIPTSTGRYVAIETMKGQQMDREKKLSEIEKAKPSFFKSAYSWLKVALIDNQAAVLTALANIGKQGQLVKAYLLTRNSASATASILSDKAINEVYGDISKKKMFDINGAKVSEYQLLNQMIGYQRVISIQQQMNDVYKSMIQALRDGNMAQYNIDKQRLVDNNMMDKNGDYVGENLDVEFAMGQVTSTQAKALLYETREAIGEAAFDKLMNSSKKYSDFLNSMLKSRMEAGLISEESYKYMSKFFYAPTKYISEILTDPILSLTKTSTSFRNESILRVKNLAGGSEKLNMSDYEGLLKAVTYASEYSIAENRATTRFYDLVSGNPTKFEEAGIRIGTKLVPITEEIGNKPGQVEDVIDRNTRMIVEGKKSSALELPSGQKALPFKGMQKVGEMGVQLYQAPVDIITDSNGNKFRIVQELLREGEDYIKTYFGGQRYDIIVPAWFAEQWYNKNTITNSTITSATSFLSKVTGANFLRVVATGINPVFGVAQLIPDTISAYAATLEERKLPLLIDYPIFFAKTLLAARDIKSNSKDFQEAMKYGATTNFYNGGMVSFEQGLLGKEDKSLEKVIESWNVPGLKQYIIGSKKITETTEQMSKVALYKSIRDSKLAQFAKDNGREPNAQEIEDIRIEAGAMARATADFHRKGVLGGELNKIIPYLNAGFQVQKAVISSAKANPKKALYYAMEFAAYGTMLTLSALGMGDDDELKEKKRKAYLKLSEFDRDNRAILYYIESKDRFVSVKLPDFLVPMQSLQRRLTERTYLENKSLNNKDVLSIASNVTDAIPVTQFANLEKVASRNPAYSFISKLKYNRDPYRQEEVVPYEKATKDYLEGAEAGKRRAGKIYQTIGKAAISPLLPEGISPKRMEAAVGSIPFQSNPFSGAILMGLEWSASEKDLFDERYGKTTRDVIMKASGITDRYMKEGSKINQNIIDLPMEEVKGRGEFKNTIAEMLIPKFDSAVVNLTRPEAFKKVRTEFINNEYKKLTPEQKEISRAFIEGELKSMAKTKTKDEFVLQIAKMAGSDAKIDGILETISTIKVSSASKVQFIRDLVDAGLVSSPGTQKSMNVRGRKTLTTGEKNPYYEPEVGYIRDEILKYVEEKKKPQ